MPIIHPSERAHPLIEILGLALLALAVFGAGTLQADSHEAGEEKAEEKTTAAAASTQKSMEDMIGEGLDKIPTGEEGIDQILGELTKQLELTTEQQGEIRPIIGDTVGKMEKTRDRFKAGEINAMALGMQIQMASQKSARLIEPILTEEQQVQYKAMQMKQRKEMMEAMRAAQQPAAASTTGAAAAGGE